MKKNLQIVAALLASLCFALAQDESRPAPVAPPPAPADTAPAAPTPLPAPAVPAVIDPTTGLPIYRTNLPSRPQPAPQIDPTTGLPITEGQDLKIDPATGLPVAPTSPNANPLANGAVEEEGNLNLEAAMNSYQSVISRFDGERPEAAYAIFRLAECYRKLGRIEEAKVQYARILREFPDRVELTKLSQKYLSEPMKGQPPFEQRLQAIVKPAPAPQDQEEDSAARQRAMYNMMMRYFGRYMRPDMLPIAPVAPARPSATHPQSLQTTPADSRGTVSDTAGLTGAHYSPNATGFITVRHLDAASASNPVAREKTLIQEQIKLVEKKLRKLEEPRKQNLVSDDSINDVKMQLLSLQRELAAWEAKNTVREIVPPAATSTSSTDLSTSPPTPAATPTSDSKKESLEPTLDELRSAALAAKQQLDDLDTLMKTVTFCQPEALPKEAANDPRYQEIKHEYESFFGIQTDLSKQKVEAARNKMRTWVNNIYLPELVAQLQFLHSKYNRLSKEYRERIARANAPHAETKLPTATSDTKPGPAHALPTPPPAPEAPKPANPF